MEQTLANGGTSGPVVLIVRDGWGRNPHPEHDPFNAVKLARTPVCGALLRDYPWTLIKTSGEDVGLPDGTMGNSEVGHQNLGAGRIVDQESVRITKAVENGDLFKNEVLRGAIAHAIQSDRYVHLMGIASDAGVHGLLSHLYACLELCHNLEHTKVSLHLFTDGRDTGPFTGKDYIEQIEIQCARIGVGVIATVSGRYYAMDRDNRWERIAQAHAAMTGQADETAHFCNAAEAVQDYYDHATNASRVGDEFITPRTIGTEWQKTRIAEGDTVIFYNYRGDRPRELVKAFTFSDTDWSQVSKPLNTGCHGFDRGKPLGLHFVTMTAYERQLPVGVAFPKPPKMDDIAGQYLSELGLRQFRCAETEKFPHVTFFFNDYREEPFEGEQRQMAQSPQVSTYDLQPQMSASEVTQLALARLGAEDCEDFILINFANGDMVGHTGKLDPAIKAVETVDQCVGQIIDATFARNGKLIVTADHGNAEQMFDPQTNAPHTAHTTYDVECILVDRSLDKNMELRDNGRLNDVLPTALKLMGLDKPAAMTGQSLL